MPPPSSSNCTTRSRKSPGLASSLRQSQTGTEIVLLFPTPRREHNSPPPTHGISDDPNSYLARGESAGVHHIVCVSDGILVGSVQRRSRKCHQPGPGGFEDTKGSNQFREGIDSAGFGGAVQNLAKVLVYCGEERTGNTNTSTIQLFVLMSSTFPPN